MRWNWEIGQGICLEFVLSIRILLRHFFHHSILFFRFISDQSKVRIFLTFLYSLFHSLFYNKNTLQFFFLTISQYCWWNSIEKGYGHMKMVTICFSSRVNRRSKNRRKIKKELWIVYFFFFSVLIIFSLVLILLNVCNVEYFPSIVFKYLRIFTLRTNLFYCYIYWVSAKLWHYCCGLLQLKFTVKFAVTFSLGLQILFHLFCKPCLLFYIIYTLYRLDLNFKVFQLFQSTLDIGCITNPWIWK